MSCRGDGRRNARHRDGQRHQSLYSFSFSFYICLFLLAMGLHCFAQAFSGGERGLLVLAVCGLLVSVASLAVEHRL